MWLMYSISDTLLKGGCRNKVLKKKKNDKICQGIWYQHTF